MNKKQLILTASLLGVVFSKAAIAKETLDDRWYLAPSVSYIWTDEDRLTSRNDYGINLGVGKALNQNFNLEVKGIFNRFEHLNSLSGGRTQYQWESYGASADLQYYFNRNRLSPYAVIGAGVLDSRVQGKTALGVIAEAGLGVAYKISDKISLRSDVRYRFNDNCEKYLVASNTNQYNEMLVNVGVVIPLGKAPSKTSMPNPSPKPTVSEEKIVLRGVNFGINSANLTNDSKTILDKLAEDLKANSHKKSIEIGGHSSSDGNKDKNTVLSQKRAEAVVEYLKNKGVTNNMSSKGYGSSEPIADEATAAGRNQNRRVELTWK